MKDPDIVWAAEIEQDWLVDIPSLEEEWDKGVITLKQLRTREHELHWSSPYLADLVFEAVLKGDLPIFKDPQCKIRADIFREFPGMDTVITFDPETYEGRIVAVYYRLSPFDQIRAWRLRQVLAYHKKSATWSTSVISIAPLVGAKNIFWDTTNLRPAFWFKPDNKRQKLRSNRIVWAKKTVSGKQPKTEVPPNPANPVKATNGFQNPVSHLFRVLEADMKTPFYDSWGTKLLTPDERKSMLSKTDTIFSYYPGTYEEEVLIVRKEINADSIHQLRLVQTWCWDERRHRLSISLDAVAPLIDVFDGLDNFRYTRPLFYKRARR